MNEFVNNVLTELKSSKTLSTMPLISMLIESTNKSISLKENPNSIYTSFRSGIAAINERVKSKELSNILTKFDKNDATPDVLISRMANEVDFKSKITRLRESAVYSTPIIKSKVEDLSAVIESGQPHFLFCESFVKHFKQYNYDKTVNATINEVTTYVNENRPKLTVLNALYQMNNSVTKAMYAGIANGLSEMLISESVTADSIKMKYGTELPLVKMLVSDLKVLEAENGGDFTLGEGNGDTVVKNVITPAIQIEEGILMYVDDKFISIRESKGLVGNEKEVFIDEEYKISQVEPSYVKNRYSDFYSLSEAFANLGFKVSEYEDLVESSNLRNMRIGLKINENKNLDLYLNGTLVGDKDKAIASIYETMVLESDLTKSKALRIIENSDEIVNFEFIKHIQNARTLSEAYVFSLNKDFYLCEKVNKVEGQWKKVDEYELYEYFKLNFKYDVSKIFKTKIDAGIAKIRKIESDKVKITEDIAKLQDSSNKLGEALTNPNIDDDKKEKLLNLKEGIDSNIASFKEQYLRLDLEKKREVATKPKEEA